jgi:retron-type reverse transcriptase
VYVKVKWFRCSRAASWIEDLQALVDVDLKHYFDTILHELLLELVGRHVGDVRVLQCRVI